MEKSLKNIFENFDNLSMPFLNIQKEFSDAIKQQNEAIKRVFRAYENSSKILQEFFKRAQDHINKLPEYLYSLSLYGWYLDFNSDFDLTSTLIKYVNEQNSEKINEILIDYYKSQFTYIFKKLEERHVNRKEIFKQIKFAYDNQHYYLAINSILTQIDGITYDFSKERLYFFSNEKKKGITKPKISNDISISNDMLVKAFCSPIQNKTPIISKISELNQFPSNLNRHEILHGMKVDYGSEENCLKCISLITYLSDIYNTINEKN